MLERVDLVIARNPDPASRLPYLIRVPLGAGGRVLRTSGTWPREKALYCYPVPAEEWPAEPDIVERVPVRSCVRRGAAIDLVLQRSRENRSQIVYTTARGREAVFWQSPRTRKQARPQVRTPTARAAGLADLRILVDTRERYPYRFAKQQVTVERRALPVGDYAVAAPAMSDADGAGDPERAVVAVVERKSLADLVGSLLNGTLRFRLAELAAVPRAAVVVEDRWSQVFALERVRPSEVADGLAELQVRWPGIPMLFCETRSLAEEWTYRYLAAAWTWACDEDAAQSRVDLGLASSPTLAEIGAYRLAPSAPAHDPADPSAATIRAWARSQGMAVRERGRVPASVRRAWREANP
ncbi:MAG TPA: histone-like nucleoid-structuring protein Lsr2 [Kineosporiaceae bacterium]|nr:histone-like nucleoid-structuring protein Lsr2 [Kineosporiaceae bacterium]